MLTNDDLQKLETMQFSDKKNNYILNSFINNIKIDFRDFPVIDHSTVEPYVDLPEVSITTYTPVLHVLMDMAEDKINIDNPNFIRNSILVDYVKQLFFFEQSPLHANLIQYIKRSLMYMFNLDNHIYRETPSGKEVMNTFNKYSVKNVDIYMQEQNLCVHFILTIGH